MIGGEAPLHWAAYKGHLEIVKLLLDNHADANLQNNDGKAPLDKAKKRDIRLSSNYSDNG